MGPAGYDIDHGLPQGGVLPPRMIAPGISPTRHFFTVDVEEYFQVSAFDGVLSRDTWPEMPSRVSESVGIVLDLLARRGVQGTFFTLGWVAKRHPAVVKRIAAAGHEVASHGWWHQKVTSLSEPQFREDVRRAKDVLEDITGARVLGYRAPSFSIVPGREWAFDVLIEEGHVYDSSVFPVRRAGYGYPGATPIAHVIDRPSGAAVRVPAGDAGVEWRADSAVAAADISGTFRTTWCSAHSASTTRRSCLVCSTFTRGNWTPNSRGSPCRC